MIKDKLQIFLITYNRYEALKNTLEQILAQDSPIKNYDITIINNASTDGTEGLILDYQRKFSNIKYIKNPINIGGNANICRAYELSAAIGKEYSWILCDDDEFNFSNWKEVEENINLGKDIICVSNYVFPNAKDFNNKAYQMFQLTFVPACIYKTKNLTDKIMFSMYESIFTMFPQSVLTASIINDEQSIHVLSKPIIFNGLHFENKRKNSSFKRGTSKKVITERKQNETWTLGFVNVISILKDKKLKKECLEVAIPYCDIYGSWLNFYNNLRKLYLNRKNFDYFYEIYKSLKLRRKIEFNIVNIARFIPVLTALPAWIHSLRVALLIAYHNNKI